MEAFLRIIELLEHVLLKIIDKMNIVTIMLLLVLLGFMNRNEVFQWFEIIGKTFKGLLP